jgi:putative salt-induced outer membrane protein YdiY
MYQNESRRARTPFLLAATLLTGVTAFLPGQQATDSTHFTADMRFVSSAGNASASTLSLGDKFDRILGAWTLGQDFQLIYGRSAAATVANFYHAALRAKYDVSARSSALAYVAWERNTPAGLARRFEEGLGVEYKVLEHPRDKIGVEAGPTFVQESRPPLANQHFVAARLAGKYDHAFKQKASFEQTVEYLPDVAQFANYLLNSQSTLAVPMSGVVALAVSYDVRYVNQPPPGRQKADRFLTAGLQITL